MNKNINKVVHGSGWFGTGQEKKEKRMGNMSKRSLYFLELCSPVIFCAGLLYMVG